MANGGENRDNAQTKGTILGANSKGVLSKIIRAYLGHHSFYSSALTFQIIVSPISSIFNLWISKSSMEV